MDEMLTIQIKHAVVIGVIVIQGVISSYFIGYAKGRLDEVRSNQQ